MLPTEKASKLYYNNPTETLCYDDKCTGIKGANEYRHLYFVSDREIKEGDWFIWQDEGHDYPLIMQCNGFTDNTHIKVNSNNEFGYGDWNKDFIKCKIEATTDKDLRCSDNEFFQVPQIHKLFVEFFIKNEGKTKEVNIEMEINEFQGGFTTKTDEDNMVIISLIKEKSYTRAEVKSLFIKKLEGMMPKERAVKDFDKNWNQIQCIEFGQDTSSNLDRLVYLRAISELDEFLDEK